MMTTVGSALRDQHLKGWHIEAETKWPPFCRHFVNVITMILTVKFKRNNTAFTKENSLKGQFNWNMNENAPILRYIFAKADMWCAWRRMKGALLTPTPDHRLGGFYLWYHFDWLFYQCEEDIVFLVCDMWHTAICSWVRSWNCGCLVTCFCYQLIAKPDNKTDPVPWPDPVDMLDEKKNVTTKEQNSF